MRSPPSSTTTCLSLPFDNQNFMKKLQQEKDFLLQCSVSMQQDIQTLQDTVHELAAEKKKLLQVPNTIHQLQQELDRQRECSNIQKRASQLRYNAKRRACNEGRRRLQRQERETAELRATQDQLQRNVDLLRRELDRQRRSCASFRLEAQQLPEELNAKCAAETRVRHENNRFSDEIRKTVLQLQGEANIPASRCSAVIKIVAENMFSRHFLNSDLPCLQTSISIADACKCLQKSRRLRRF